jgi:hypothetical protein
MNDKEQEPTCKEWRKTLRYYRYKCEKAEKVCLEHFPEATISIYGDATLYLPDNENTFEVFTAKVLEISSKLKIKPCITKGIKDDVHLSARWYFEDFSIVLHSSSIQGCKFTPGQKGTYESGREGHLDPDCAFVLAELETSDEDDETN